MTDVRVGVHALDLRGAAPRVSLEARLAGPALLGEACALPLAVVSTGDAMDAVTLAFKTRGDSEVSEVSEAETVEVARRRAAARRSARTTSCRSGASRRKGTGAAWCTCGGGRWGRP